MKIGLNDRSAQELLEIMAQLNITTPKHCVQTMITQLHKSLFPNVEDYHATTNRTQNKAV